MANAQVTVQSAGVEKGLGAGDRPDSGEAPSVDAR